MKLARFFGKGAGKGAGKGINAGLGHSGGQTEVCLPPRMHAAGAASPAHPGATRIPKGREVDGGLAAFAQDLDLAF